MFLGVYLMSVVYGIWGYVDIWGYGVWGNDYEAC
jgi:hypothetical protein